METLAELEEYLEAECYSFQGLSIGKHQAYEGIVIEKSESLYSFSFSERGNKKIIKSFSKEKDLVDYALDRLSKNQMLKSHLVAWVWNEYDIQKAEKELQDMNIPFERSDIHNFSKGKAVFRIFVFGKDILALDSFKARYIRSCKEY